MDTVLAPPEEDHLAGSEANDLAAYLRPNGSPRPGHEHALAPQVLAAGIDGEAGRVARQKVGHLDVAELRQCDRSVHRLETRRQYQMRGICGPAQVDDALQLRAGCGGNGDRDLVGIGPPEDLRKTLAGPEHLGAAHDHVPPQGIIVEEANNFGSAETVVLDAPGQRSPGLAGSVDQHTPAFIAVRRSAGHVDAHADHAPGEATSPDEREPDKPYHHERGRGKRLGTHDAE